MPFSDLLLSESGRSVISVKRPKGAFVEGSLDEDSLLGMDRCCFLSQTRHTLCVIYTDIPSAGHSSYYQQGQGHQEHIAVRSQWWRIWLTELGCLSMVANLLNDKIRRLKELDAQILELCEIDDFEREIEETEGKLVS
jgi:hypothetical protein